MSVRHEIRFWVCSIAESFAYAYDGDERRYARPKKKARTKVKTGGKKRATAKKVGGSEIASVVILDAEEFAEFEACAKTRQKPAQSVLRGRDLLRKMATAGR